MSSPGGRGSDLRARGRLVELGTASMATAAPRGGRKGNGSVGSTPGASGRFLRRAASSCHGGVRRNHGLARGGLSRRLSPEFSGLGFRCSEGMGGRGRARARERIEAVELVSREPYPLHGSAGTAGMAAGDRRRAHAPLYFRTIFLKISDTIRSM